MKLKLTQSGYEKFTGQFGIVDFVDGVSVGDVNAREARNIAVSIGCEFEDGSSPNPAQILLNSMNDRAGEVKPENKPEPAVFVPFTKEQLEKVADEKGIKGLRQLADPLKIKGTSIVELIKELLEYKPEPAKTEQAE